MLIKADRPAENRPNDLVSHIVTEMKLSGRKTNVLNVVNFLTFEEVRRGSS